MDGKSALRFAEEFVETDGDGVNLFAGGATGDPDADGVAAPWVVGKHFGKRLAQDGEGFGIAKKAGDADEQVAIELAQLVGMLFGVAGIIAESIETQHHHAAADTAADGGGFVMGEIDFGAGAQEIEDALEVVAIAFGEFFGAGHTGAGGDEIRMVADFGEFAADIGGAEDEIDGTGGDGIAGHAAEAGGGFILCKGDAAFRFDSAQAETSIGSVAGEDDADSAAALDGGQRAEEDIDGQVRAGFAAGELEVAVHNHHAGVGRDDVDAVGLNVHAIVNGDDGHFSGRRQDFAKQALVLGVEMLDEHEGHAGRRFDGAEELTEGF